jgi:ubiquinone/menaquinone biosynthesis C-methylase UbiE
LFFKEIRSVLFNRRLAASSGVPERLIYYALLFLTGAVVSSNLATVGGLLIFALLVQPGATALQLTYNLKHFFLISAASGISACVFGLIVSFIFDLPSGASVVLMATILFASAYIFSPKRRLVKFKKGKYPMKMTPDEIYRTRKLFFNDHAEKWLDMWYRDPATGRYDKHEKDFERLFSLLPLKPGDKVLDAGCGTGVLVPFVLERITSTGILYELDFSEKMIEINRNLHARDNIRFIVSDAENAPLDDTSCDVIVCFSSFPHFQDKEKAMTVLSRILNPRGAFVVSHFNSSEEIKKHHGSCHAVMHDHLPEESAIRSLFQQVGLKIGVFIDEPGFYCIIAKK